MLLYCPSFVSPAQRSLPPIRKACFSVPIFYQHRAAEPPQKSMLLCPSFISPAQRSLPRKACFSAPLPSAPRSGLSGASPEEHASLPLFHQQFSPAQRSLPRKAACYSLLLFHQHRAAEAPQKSMLLCSSSISTAQRKLLRKAACFSAPLPSAPRSGSSPENHASLLLFHQHRAAEAPHRKAYI